MKVLWEDKGIKKIALETVQINLGNRCNQRCMHCHIDASPKDDKNMDNETAEHILEKLISIRPHLVEFTGGSPEMNPNLKMFLEKLSKSNIKTAVRTNLTILSLPTYSYMIDIYARHGVKVVASLPSYFKDITDKLRGKGVFEKSIDILKKLNSIGYGNGELELDLVYNPSDAYLPSSLKDIEYEYRNVLKASHGIEFNRLITIANAPIGGFKKYLIRQKNYDNYMRLLVNNFNAETLNHIMCRNLISVDYEGHVYDCDFNLSLGIRIKDYEDKKFWEINFENFNPEISCGEHCYACTAASGSSCYGTLLNYQSGQSEQSEFNAHETVKKYYGKELKDTSDLKTGACCTSDFYPQYIKDALAYIAPEIKQKYYGCGSPIPVALKGLKVLDLGCGTGRDRYILSKLVGQEGMVYGIDMT